VETPLFQSSCSLRASSSSAKALLSPSRGQEDTFSSPIQVWSFLSDADGASFASNDDEYPMVEGSSNDRKESIWREGGLWGDSSISKIAQRSLE